MLHQQQEITEKDFDNEINDIHYSDFSKAKNCFQLAQSYHKQELSKVLGEAGKGLPTYEEIKVKLEDVYRDDGNRASYWYQQGLIWMRDKSSLVIAALKEEMKTKVDYYEDKYDRLHVTYSNQAKELSEKDELIAEKDDEIKDLKSHIEDMSDGD